MSNNEAPTYINYLPLHGRGAMINIVIAPRDVGKTFTAILWGTRRFIKTGKKFIWVRRTEEETKTAKGKFFKKKLLKLCGLSRDDVRVKGNYAYMKRGRKWVDFVEFCSLSTASTQRSVDDEEYNMMFVDEAFATPAKVAQFRGDEVREFIDLYISKKRDHKLTAYLLGNRETIDNPYYRYFGITPPPYDRESITMYQNGTLAVWVVPKMKAATVGHDRVDDLLAGTAYGDYLTGGAAKCAPVAKYALPPRVCYTWAEIDVIKPITVYGDGCAYYVRKGCRDGGIVFVSRETQQKYRRSIIYNAGEKFRFATLARAYKLGRLYFEDEATAETGLATFDKLGIFQ